MKDILKDWFEMFTTPGPHMIFLPTAVFAAVYVVVIFSLWFLQAFHIYP